MEDTRKKILLLDDEPDITYIVQFILSNSGFDVATLNDSSKAMEELASGNYSLLILDLMMPRIDGFTLLENMRKEQSLSKIPVLILSSRQLSQSETGFLNMHHAEVMAKPFEPHRLLENVREILAD